MRNDSLKEYVRLHRELVEERAKLTDRLHQINEALGHMSPVTTAAVQRAATNKGPLPSTMEAAMKPESTTRGPWKKRGGISAEGRARIAEAQRKRWAAAKGVDGSGAASSAAVSGEKRTGQRARKMSPAARKRLAEAARRRWAEAKAVGKSTL